MSHSRFGLLATTLLWTAVYSLVIPLPSFAGTQSESNKSLTASIGFSGFACDRISDPFPQSEDEVYFLVNMVTSDGRSEKVRWPSSGTKDMHVGDKRDDDPKHRLPATNLIDIHLGVGQQALVKIVAMDEDDGNDTAGQKEVALDKTKVTKVFNTFKASSLHNAGKQSDDAGEGLFGILFALVAVVIYTVANNHDDVLGSCLVHLTNVDGQLKVDWEKGNFAGGKPMGPLEHEFRFNGDDGNYVGWFYARSK